MTQPARPACRLSKLWEGVGDRRRRSAWGSRASLTRVGDKGLCWAAAKPWQTKGPGGRMNHQPLSASFVLGWASLNSAELSRSGRAVISIQLAWLTGPAGREVLCTGVWVRPWVTLAWTSSVPYRAGFLYHNSQPGSGRSPVVNTVVAEKDSCPQTHSRAPEQLVQFPRGKLFPIHRRPCSGPQPRLHLARLGHPLPGLHCERGGGRRGGARSCRRPPGPVGTREGMFLPPPARPARAACRTLALQNATPGLVGAAHSRSSRFPL